MKPLDQTPVSSADKRRHLSDWLAQADSLKAGRTRVPLSEMQESFLVGREYSGDSDRVGCHAYFEFTLPHCDVGRLHATFQRLVDHHEMLRARIHEDGTQSVQAAVTVPPFDVVDLRSESPDAAQRALGQTRADLSHRVYEVEAWPLWSVCLAKLPSGEDRVHVSIDEWLTDASGISLLMAQWKSLYEGLEDLPPSTASFLERLRRQRDDVQHQAKRKADLAYWVHKLEGMPPGPVLPSGDRPRSKPYYERVRLASRLEREEAEGLRALAKAHRVSVTSLLLTLFGDVLAQCTGAARSSLILTLSDRPAAGEAFERVVAPLVSTGIFIADCDRGQTFRERVEHTQRELWEDLDHGAVAASSALRELKRQGRLARDLALPVVFTSMLHNVGKGHQEGWFEQQTYGVTQTPQVWLDHHVIERLGALQTHWDVALDYFPEGEIESWFAYYQRALRSLCATADLDTFRLPERVIEFPLTPEQQALIVGRGERRESRGATIYQELSVPAFDFERFSKALSSVVASSAALRSFATAEGTQRLLDRVPPCKVIRHACRVEEADAAVQQARARMLAQHFPLGSWPMFSVAVTEVADERRAVVHLSVDPVIMDGPTLQRFYIALFASYAGGDEASLLANRAQASASSAPTPVRSEDRSYWSHKMAVLPSGPVLPGIAPSADSPPTRLAHEMPGLDALRRVAASWNVRCDALLLTAYLRTLSAWSGVKEVACVVVDWAASAGTEGRDIRPHVAFRWVTYAHQHADVRSQAQAHEAMLLADEQHPTVSGLTGMRERMRSGQPLSLSCVFTTTMNDVALGLAANAEMGFGLSDTPGVGVDCIAFAAGDSLALHWDARIAKGEERKVEEMFRKYHEEVSAIAHLEQAHQGVPEVGPAVCIHETFERSVGRFGERTAVSFGKESLSYAALDARANQLAHRLIALGVGRGAIVGLCVERSVELVVAILGVLKAGAAYLPLDIHYPPERIRSILEDAETAAVVTFGVPDGALAGVTAPRVRLDAHAAELAALPVAPPRVKVQASDAAYVIYTSGSTGKPKGVVVEHGNVHRLFTQTDAWYGFNEHDVWTLYHSYAFDFSVWEIWGALFYGGRLVVVPYQTSRSFSSFHDLLVDEGVTVLNQTPTAFRYLLDADGSSSRSSGLRLRYVVFGGEKLELALLRPWFERHGRATRLVNMYGITETTVHVTYRPIEPHELHLPSVIGVPIPDLTLHVFDSNLKAVPEGEVGEIYVEGAGVTRGYLNRPELTRERFVERNGKRLYKTGDLARRRSDGELEFIGRGDKQVQIRGFRVELGEIEARVSEMAGVRACAVLLQDEGSEDPKLVAAVVLGTGKVLNPKEVRHWVGQRLPDYMIPNRIVAIDELPLTPEGKLDRRVLLTQIAGDVPSAKAQGRGEDLARRLTALAESVLGVPVGVDDDLFDLGATSLSVVNFAKRVDRELGRQVPLEVLLRSCTVRGVTAYLEGLAEEQEVTVARAPAVVTPVVDDRTLERVLEVMREVLRTPTLTSDDNVFDAGATSLSVVNMARTLRSMHGLNASVEMFLQHPTPKGVSDALTALRAAPTVAAAPQCASPAPTILPRDSRLLPGSEHSLRARETSVPLSRSVLETLLGLFAERVRDGESRRLYASAGGKYAVDVYLSLAHGQVPGMAGGHYRYDPRRHGLIAIASPSDELADSALTGGPLLSLAARGDGLSRTYGALGSVLAVVETGYMMQLALGGAVELGLAPEIVAGGLRFGSGARVTGAVRLCTGSARSAYSGADPLALVNPVTLADARALSGGFGALGLMGDAAPEAAAEDAPLSVRFGALPALERELRLRKSCRAFAGRAIPLVNLAGLLELMGKWAGEGFETWVHIGKGKVTGLDAGLYRYMPGEHVLVALPQVSDDALTRTHAPFNRAHASASGFSLMVFKRGTALSGDPAATHRALLAVGRLGQQLMESQSAFGLGLVPIGGQSLTDLRSALHLEEDEVLLHAFVGGAYDHGQSLSEPLTLLRGKLERESSVPPEALRTAHGFAVIGMSGRYPGAEDLDSLWRNLREGRVSITPRREGSRSEAVRAAGYLSDLRGFDPVAFRISPAEARMMDPQERLVLESVCECIENAGYGGDALKEHAPRVGVFVGAMWSDYEKHEIGRAAVDSETRAASLHSSIANRVSWHFGLQGPSLAVNTACSSSLTALKLACDALERGECDLAVVSGVNAMSHDHHYDALLGQKLISEDGVGRAFSEKASGLIPGEGVGTVLLRRVDDAERGGDFIYCVIKGAAINHAGHTARFGMPSSDQLVEALRSCCESAQIHPSTISYVESAAAGSALGDAAEASAVARVLGRDGERCRVGSIKPNIGHLESASTMSQLAKVACQLAAETIAPTVHAEPLNPLLGFAGTRFEVATERTEWKRSATPRRVLLNSFGALGSNGSLLIEEASQREVSDPHAGENPALVVFSAPSRGQLASVLRTTLSCLETGLFRPRSVADVALTLQRGRRELAVRVAFVSHSLEHLTATLRACVQHDCAVEGVHCSFHAQSKTSGSSELDAQGATWVAGGAIDTRVAPVLARRTPLPGYAFERRALWLEETDATPALPPPVTAAKSMEGKRVSDTAVEDHKRAVLSWLAQIYASVSEHAGDELDPDRALEEYGLSSIQVVALTEQVGRRFKGAAPTLWFECQTLRAVVQHLLSNYQDGWLSAEQVQAAASATSTSHRSQALETVPASRDLAVVGLSGRFPGAPDVNSFWRNLRDGLDVVSEIPSARFRVPPFGESSANKVRCRWGGFVADVDKFDPLFFKMSQTEAELTDPQERLFLQTAWETLEDAGYNREELTRAIDRSVGVFVGVMYNEYQLLGGEQTLRGNTMALGSSAGSIANRVSYFLDLQGPSLAIDTMCSSSLVALHLAAQSIERGECRAAIVGAANLTLHPNKYLMQSQMNMLSPTGHCHAFGAAADGFVPSEAIAAVLVRPLSDALRDGDHIYGVIKGTATYHGGKSNGYTVPSPKAQAELIGRALAAADVTADSISYVEAHGTGTALGDPIEAAGLSRAFKGSTRACPVGSVKSNLGHAEAAAGMVSLTKVLLQLTHGELVPSLHSEPANPKVDFAEVPFFVQRTLSPWPEPVNREGSVLPRRAGISSFGAGGVGAHVIVEQAPTLVALTVHPPTPQLVVLSARSELQLQAHAVRLRDRLRQGGMPPATQPSGMVMTARVCGMLSELLGLDVDPALTDNMPLAELGLTPSQLEMLRDALLTRFDAELSPSSLETSTVASLAAVLCERGALSRGPDAPGDLGPLALADVAFTLQVGRDPFAHRLAFVASSTSEACERLDAYLRGDTMEGLWLGEVKAAHRELGDLLKGEEGRAFLAQLVKNGRLSELGRLWVRGIEVDFRALPDARFARRVSLPTYPFAKQRCWVPGVAEGEGSTRPEAPVSSLRSISAVAPNVIGLVRPERSALVSVQQERVGLDPRSLIRREVATLVGHPIDAVDCDAELADLGCDSVIALKLKHVLERFTASEIPLEMLSGSQSITALAKRLTDAGLLRPESLAASEQPLAQATDTALIELFDDLEREAVA